jgi:DNA polymerase-4
VVIPPDIAKYKQVSAAIRSLFAQATPLIEPVSLDEAYLDLSPDVRLVDRPPALLLARLAAAIESRIGITVSVGLSYNKFLAKLASDRDKPRGFAVIGRAEAKTILAELPVRALWGIGEATAKRMAEHGITTVAQLQAMPEAELSARWGKFGRQLAGLVQGIDHRRVTPDRPAKSVSTETTFARDIRDAGALAQALEPLAEGVGRRLGRESAAGRTVVLKLKTADFQVITRHHRLGDPTRRSDVILEAGKVLLNRLADGRAFRLIGIGVTDLCPAAEADPPDLFGTNAPA